MRLRLAGAEPSDYSYQSASVQAGELWIAYRLMVIPGGFSYGDDVAAGKILANELRFKLRDALDDLSRKASASSASATAFRCS